MKRPGKKIALSAGLIAIALAGLLAVRYQDMVYWWYGYRVIWMPEGIVPSPRHSKMNSSGQVPVIFGDPPQGGRWSLASGELVRLGTLPGAAPDSRTVPYAVSERGAVLGAVTAGENEDARAFLWTAEGGMAEIPGFGGKAMEPLDINSRNQVVGWADVPGKGKRPFIWEPSAPTRELGGPGEGAACAINEKGWVVGHLANRPFLWTPEAGMKDLGLAPGFTHMFICGLNNRGDVVLNFLQANSKGTADINTSRPFLWTAEKGLAPLPFPEGYAFTLATEITDDGTIGMGATTNFLFGTGDCYVLRSGVLRWLPVPFGHGAVNYTSMNGKGWQLGSAVRRVKGGQGTETRGLILQPIR